MNDKIIIYIISENLSLLYNKDKQTYIIPPGYPYRILIKNKSSKNIICNLSINNQLYSSSNINYYDDYETETTETEDISNESYEDEESQSDDRNEKKKNNNKKKTWKIKYIYMTNEEKNELLIGEGEDEQDSIEKANNINKHNIK